MALATLPLVPRLVAIDAGAGPAFVEDLRTVWTGGDAAFPVDPRLPAAARRRLMARMAVGEEVAPGDALVVATSGSTGEPKGVVLTHEAVAAAAHAVTARIDALDGPGYGWLACLPLAHVGGLGVVTRALVTGRPLQVLGGFRPADVEAAARAADLPVVVALVATALQRVDAGLFRRIILGGSRPPARLPANVTTTYGMTETGGGVVHDGIPLDGVQIRVVADNRIEVRGPMLLRCYRDGRDPLVDGWLATGDVGRLDADGRLHVEGRAEELIVTGGENVWPAPVEDLIRSMAGVRDVAVIGREDPEWGQRVVAVVVPEDAGRPPALVDIRDRVKQVMGPWCAPRELELVPALPRSALGKLRRATLRRATLR